MNNIKLEISYKKNSDEHLSCPIISNDFKGVERQHMLQLVLDIDKTLRGAIYPIPGTITVKITKYE